jgi:hypothetical protein
VDGEVNRLAYGPFNQHPVIGWPAAGLLLTYTRRSAGSSEELRTVNLLTGETDFILTPPFLEAAYDPGTGAVLLNRQPVDYASADSLPGIYRLNPEGEGLELLLPGSFSGLRWQGPLAQFQAVQDGSYFVIFDETGEQSCTLEYRPGDQISYSPDERWMVVSNPERSNLYASPCELILQIHQPGVLFWLPDSSGFYFHQQAGDNSVTIYRHQAENGWEAETIREKFTIQANPTLISP